MSETKKELDEAFCKGRMLEMLATFDEFCEKNGLTYFLTFGTLLGAIRHKGFIPWDDDIDISMPRKDYNRLIQLSKNWELSYDFLCWEKDEKYPKCFGKLSDRETILDNFYMENIPCMGLFVDIFPMDDVAVDKNESIRLQKRIEHTSKMLALASMKKFWPSQSVLKSAAKYVLYKVAKLKGIVYWRNKQETIIKQVAPGDGCNCGYCVCDYSVIPNKWFSETEKIDFEGYSFYAPKEADSFLRYYYGDYMTPPPVEERVSVHDHKVYRRTS